MPTKRLEQGKRAAPALANSSTVSSLMDPILSCFLEDALFGVLAKRPSEGDDR